MRKFEVLRNKSNLPRVTELLKDAAGIQQLWVGRCTWKAVSLPSASVSLLLKLFLEVNIWSHLPSYGLNMPQPKTMMILLHLSKETMLPRWQRHFYAHYFNNAYMVAFLPEGTNEQVLLPCRGDSHVKPQVLSSLATLTFPPAPPTRKWRQPP